MSDEPTDSDNETNEPDPKTLGDGSGVYVPEAGAEDDEEDLPPMDFGNFVMSLGTSVMVNLGHVDDEDFGVEDANLPAARQTIEILEMLEHKTEGNLEPEEQKLLESLLHDTRLAYQRAEREAEDADE
jgi:hypothetical protein